MKKKSDTEVFQFVWIILCLAWLILSLGFSMKGMPDEANRCVIHVVLFYLFFMTNAIRSHFDDVKRKLDEMSDKKEADDQS